MAYKGKSFWIAGDVLTRLYAGKDLMTPINELLRELLDLPPIKAEISTIKKKKTQRKYDVSSLGVGESRLFEVEKKFYHVKQSVDRYGLKTGKKYFTQATYAGTLVTRIL